MIPGTRPTVFNGGGSGFAILGFQPEGNVYFSYGVTASADGSGFAIDAGSDIDGDGVVQFWGYVKPDSAGGIPAGQVGCNTAALARPTEKAWLHMLARVGRTSLNKNTCAGVVAPSDTTSGRKTRVGIPLKAERKFRPTNETEDGI